MSASVICGGNIRPTRNVSNILDIHRSTPFVYCRQPFMNPKTGDPFTSEKFEHCPAAYHPFSLSSQSREINAKINTSATRCQICAAHCISTKEMSSVICCTPLVYHIWIVKNALEFYVASRNPNFSTVSGTCFLSMLDISWFCSSWDVASIC